MNEAMRVLGALKAASEIAKKVGREPDRVGRQEMILQNRRGLLIKAVDDGASEKEINDALNGKNVLMSHNGKLVGKTG